MRKSKVDSIFKQDANRKRKIITYIFLIVILSLITICLFLTYLKKSKVEYINYNGTSSVDYKVYLKNNNFFKEQYLGKDREYIASLIDYINAQFEYNISLDNENADIQYTKRIEADVEVYDVDGKKPLYKVTEEILKPTSTKSQNSKNIQINENVKIDYNHYNDLISNFKSTYDLQNVTSTLTINMYVSVSGSCDDTIEDTNTESIVSLRIPLTTKTMSIEMESDVTDKNDKIMICQKEENAIIILLCDIVLLLADIIFIIACVNYIIKSRSARDIYKRELKKILNNYHSFIQKINNSFDLTDYQLLKVDTFTDMLEIRDTLGQPILMVENKNQDGVHFIIPSNTKLLYTFTLREKDIQKKIKINDEFDSE